MSLLRNVKLHYPEAREWMWDYCVYLGPFTDSSGQKWDLGMYIDTHGHPSAAIVFDNKPGSYASGDFWNTNWEHKQEHYVETYRRAKEIGLVNEEERTNEQT